MKNFVFKNNKVFDLLEETERTIERTIEPYLKEFCKIFNIPYEIVKRKPFKVIKPISKRPFGGNYCGQII